MGLTECIRCQMLEVFGLAAHVCFQIFLIKASIEKSLLLPAVEPDICFCGADLWSMDEQVWFTVLLSAGMNQRIVVEYDCYKLLMKSPPSPPSLANHAMFVYSWNSVWCIGVTNYFPGMKSWTLHTGHCWLIP